MLVTASVVAACVAAVAGAQAAAGAGSSAVRVVAKGLANPRGVEIAADGSIFVAQAGVAGHRCQGSGPDQMCFGFTGSIDRIAGGTRERYGAGFLSAGGRDGSFSVGVDDVAIDPSGRVYGIVTTPGPHPERFGPVVAAQAGHVVRVDRGSKTPIGDSVGAYEFAHNPAGDNLDSDPYSIAWSPLGFAVADAAGNSLLLVGQSGRVSTLATFPAQRFTAGRVAQSVPTSVVWHNGAFYVGELGGDGTPVGKSRIWKVDPASRTATVYATGFTAITGVAFGPDGSMYVSELIKNGLAAAQKGDLTGALIRVSPSGARSELARGQLIAPAGVAVATDGTVYVATGSVFPRKGQLVAISA
jgi:hypothetical protein